ncbi:hypothetical protein CC1G_09252 [Coprinopsis cinerea okayama7|uniref:Integral membrane protein n=1 Tax=Coprinopsis cinerea (strain Okayama-7 / 130 / ATCC MYA-4618 / FGSC 9003) TaxID=240176 RepID=A8P548_COPC7|nr:hypothetical protein CC1G_09252 [Coprinopsis cinerea okayama7\|eukprot:XP_001838875.2 hypothetical protein CC1G_09252 [Coprinopsis cinerea okayama7\
MVPPDVGPQISAIVQTAVAGAQIFMCRSIFIRFLQLESHSRRVKLLYLMASFVLCLLSCGGAIASSIAAFDEFTHDSTKGRRPQTSVVLPIARPISSLASIGQRWIGDSLLAYRCWVLWNHCAWIAALPVTLLLLSLGTAIANMAKFGFLYGGLAMSLKFENPEAVTGPNAKPFITVFALDLFAHVLMHVVVTALILWRLIRVRRAMPPSFRAQVEKRYSPVAYMLIESAAFVAITGVPYAVRAIVLYAQESRWAVDLDVPMWVFSIAHTTAIALAPQLIIFHVAAGRCAIRSTTESETLSKGDQTVEEIHRNGRGHGPIFGGRSTSDDSSNIVTVTSNQPRLSGERPRDVESIP